MADKKYDYKYYLVSGDIGEDYPYFTFMLIAGTEKKAISRAKIILNDNYPFNQDFNEIASLVEVKELKDVLKYLLLEPDSKKEFLKSED